MTLLHYLPVITDVGIQEIHNPVGKRDCHCALSSVIGLCMKGDTAVTL